MNCANHPDRERVAFCQNCGKPLCASCIHTIGSSVFCEPCFTLRTAAPPVPGYVPPTSQPASPLMAGVPNPGLAALLGFIPGVGAMYNEQYAKGIVHLIVFAILVSLASDVNGVFGIFIAGWVIYQVIEAHHTARARLDGTPLPNPFGLNDLSERLGFGKSWPSGAAAPFQPGPFQAGPFQASPGQPGPGQASSAASSYTPPTAAYAAPPPPNTPPEAGVPPYAYVPPAPSWGTPQENYTYSAPYYPPVPPVPPMPPFVDSATPFTPPSRRFPSGALWLIGLGVVFLIGNAGLFHGFPARFFFPFALIGLGVWIFVHRMTAGGGLANDGTPAYSARLASAVRSSAWILITGFVWLLDSSRILPWSHSWPIFLIAAGLLMFTPGYRNYGPRYPGSYGGYPQPGYPYPPVAPAPPVQPAPGSEIIPRTGSVTIEDPRSDREGR